MLRSVKNLFFDAVWGDMEEPNVLNCESDKQDECDAQLEGENSPHPPESDSLVSFVDMLKPFKDDKLELEICSDFRSSCCFQKELYEKRIPEDEIIIPGSSNFHHVLLLIEFLETGKTDKIVGNPDSFGEVVRMLQAFSVTEAVNTLNQALEDNDEEGTGVTDAELELQSLYFEAESDPPRRAVPLLDACVVPKNDGIYFIHPETKVLLCSKDHEFEIALDVARGSKGLFKLFTESMKESAAFAGASSLEAPVCKLDFKDYKPSVLKLFSQVSNLTLPEEHVKSCFQSGVNSCVSYEDLLQLSRFVREFNCNHVAKYIQEYRLIEPILWCIPHLSCRRPPLSKEAMLELLEHIDSYDKPELDLILDLFRYSQGQKQFGESLEEYMADFVKKIRFSKISIQEYLEKIQPLNVLQPEVVDAIEDDYFNSFTKSHPPLLGHQLMSLYGCMRPTWELSREELEFRTRHINREQTLWLEPNQSFYLLGLQLYGSGEKRLTLVSLRLELQRFRPSQSHETQVYLQRDAEPFMMFFKEPIKIDVPCKIVIQSLGPSLYASTHTGIVDKEITTSLISCDFFTASIKSKSSEIFEDGGEKYFLTKFLGLLYAPVNEECTEGKF